VPAVPIAYYSVASIILSEMIRLYVKRKQSALEQAPVPEEVEEHENDMDDVQEKNHANIP
jgi:hypothetical protein